MHVHKCLCGYESMEAISTQGHDFLW